VSLLHWNRPADELRASVLPKIWLGESMAVVRTVQVSTARSTAVAGTLAAVTVSSLSVATASHDVTLREFVTLDGRALDLAELVRTARLSEGMVLPPFPSAAASAAAAQACDAGQEARWMDDLRCLKPVASPFHGARTPAATPGSSLVLPGYGSRLPASVDAVGFGMAVVLTWLARVGAASEFDIGLRADRPGLLPGAYHLLARTRPFRIDAGFTQPFERFRQECQVRLTDWQARKPYLRDAVMRYPGLMRPPAWEDFASWPVAVALSGPGDGSSARASPSGVTFAIGTPCGEVTLLHSGLPDAKIKVTARQLVTLAEDGLARPNAPLGGLALLPQAEAAALQRQVWGA
jgi:hypothetical protein